MPARHHEVTRLEGFSDAVFGFALTLLVVSLEVPTSFEALKSQMQGFFGFALMFSVVCWIWYEHNWFFRHTGLQDAWTAFLNSVLLFVVLFYVYPLKFLTASLLSAWFGIGGAGAPRLAGGNELLMLYSAVDLRYAARAHAISALLGLTSVSIAAVGYLGDWDVAAGIAGVVYFLMGPLHTWNGRQAAHAKERIVGA